MTFKFNYGKPFHPFEQLMGVLPEASKDHIPLAYRVSSFLRSFSFGALFLFPSEADSEPGSP